jgi:hypothetical protein
MTENSKRYINLQRDFHFKFFIKKLDIIAGFSNLSDLNEVLKIIKKF